VEALSFLLEGKEENAFILTVLLFLGYAFIPILSVLYSQYAYLLLTERKIKQSFNFSKIILYICIIQLILLIIGTITGKYFYIDSGYVMYGPWEKLMMIIPTLCYIIMIVPALKTYKLYGVSSVAIIIMLFAFPATAIFVVSLFDTSIRQCFTATSLTFEVVYVMIQSKIVDEANINARIYNELSVKDVMTGLRNRRGYENYISELKETDFIGVVFCDVNSLKAINNKSNSKY